MTSEDRTLLDSCVRQCTGLHTAQNNAAEHRGRQDHEIADLIERVVTIEEALVTVLTMLEGIKRA